MVDAIVVGVIGAMIVNFLLLSSGVVLIGTILVAFVGPVVVFALARARTGRPAVLRLCQVAHEARSLDWLIFAAGKPAVSVGRLVYAGRGGRACSPLP